jgi:ribulose-phosphate 3-epimerase
MAPGLPISIDGGVTLETAPSCAARGANYLIAGTALFRSADLARDIRIMREQCRAACNAAATHPHVTS